MNLVHIVNNSKYIIYFYLVTQVHLYTNKIMQNNYVMQKQCILLSSFVETFPRINSDHGYYQDKEIILQKFKIFICNYVAI